jgi:hypothetical protein
MTRPALDTPTLTASGATVGRPRKQPPADAAALIHARSRDGFSVRGVAFGLDVSERVLRHWFDEHPELKQAFDEGREHVQHTLFNRLFKIATESKDERTASTACMFLLKSMFGWREGEQQEQGTRVNITFNLPGAMSREDFLKTVRSE